MQESPAPVLTVPRVALALTLVFVLAIAAPYAAVRRLHERRIAAADVQAQALAASIRPLLGRPDPGTAVVIVWSGPGVMPKANDDRWITPSAPLSALLRSAAPAPDPWGNAFLVVLTDAHGAWVVSAGPDGTIETPFPSVTVTPAGDDRVMAIR